MYHARGIVTAADTASVAQQKSIETVDGDDKATTSWMENWYDGLTYCEHHHSISLKESNDGRL